MIQNGQRRRRLKGDILQMEASTSPNLSQLANFDKPMTTPAAFDRCPNARSGWRAGEILNLPS
jgi:hypothetical protein